MEPLNGPSEFFATGCPFFNYKKFVFKMYYVEALRDFFGFGKKKFFQILSRECCNAKFTAVQVVECYFRVINLACEFLNKKSLYVSSRLERVLKSLAPCFQYVSDQLNIAFISKYEKMKSFVIDSMNETIQTHDQDEEIITDLRNENEKLKKENVILIKEKEWLEQENVNQSNLNQQLRDVLSLDSSVVDFNNVAQQRKKEKEELIALRSQVPQLESSLNSTKQYNLVLQEKVKTLQLDITGYKEALEDVNSIESENRELISELSNKKREYDHEINKLKRNLKNSKSYEEQDYNKLKIMMTQLEKENVQLHNRVKEMEAGQPSPTTPSGSRNFSSKVVGNVQKPQNNDIKSLFLFSLPTSNKPVKKFVKSMKLNNKSFEEYLVNVLVNNSSNFYLTFENICKTLDGFYYY